jgi:DNA-binding transcriptional regulator of glucitol operon
VRERWLSKRAIFLHLGVLLFVPGCTAAAWWQITRAQDGNGLSYLYAVEWPIFALLSVYFWWMFIHTDYDTVGLKGMQRMREGSPVAAGVSATPTSTSTPTHVIDSPPAPPTPPSPTAPTAAPHRSTPPPLHTDAPAVEEDPELAAYNARLAQLAGKGPQTWRHREAPVARRPQ